MSLSSGGFIAVDLLVGRKRQIAVTFHPEPFVLENKGLDGVPPHHPPHQPPHHPLHPEKNQKQQKIQHCPNILIRPNFYSYHFTFWDSLVPTVSCLYTIHVVFCFPVICYLLFVIRITLHKSKFQFAFLSIFPT